MLGDDAAVLVALVDHLGEVSEHVERVLIGDDHQLVQRRQEARIDGLLPLQAFGV